MTEEKIINEIRERGDIPQKDTESPKKKKPLTKGQLAAVNTHGSTLLISAAAGSGKTFTLTKRIIQSITRDKDPSDISKMLIVTFTRAAAAELKERIFKALSEELAKKPSDKHLNTQLIKLGNANICTIDSFYYNLIRQNFSTLGIPASFRIADSAELGIMMKSIMDEVIDRLYDEDENFSSFADCFVGTKSINELSTPMLTLYDSVTCSPEGIELVKRNAEALYGYVKDGTDFFATTYGSELKPLLHDQIEYLIKLTESAYEYSMEYPDIFGKRADTYKSDIEDLSKLCNILGDENATFFDAREVFLAYSPATLGRVKSSDDETEESIGYKKQRDGIKAKIKYIIDNIFSRDRAALDREMIATAQYIEKLYTLFSAFKQKFDEEKSRKGIMSFKDVTYHAFRLLVAPNGDPTDTALGLKKQFTDIYIDEYQDVDSVQDKIFRVISDNNRFMVGDIKQSIYGFRGAEPKVFSEYRRDFTNYDLKLPTPPNASEISIFMSENFRCDKNVIDFTNIVCGRIFSTCTDTMGYTAEDDLIFSKESPHDDYVSPKVEVTVINSRVADEEENEDTEAKRKKKKKGDHLTAAEIEAEYIAKKVDELIKNGKKADGTDITAGDIAVLYRSNSTVAYISEALRRRNILCTEGGGDEYFENPDVLLVLSVLNVVDNPHRDIHLAGTLCSPLFEFTMDDLLTIRLKGSRANSLFDSLHEYGRKEKDALAEKCLRFEEHLWNLRKSAVALPVDRFLRVLFESDLFAASGLLADRNDYGEGGNLLRLYDYARTFESGSFKGLYNFIEFINTLIEKKKKLEVAEKAKSSDRVVLSTMHHSKGLEFPVCFICGAGRSKNMQELNKSLLYEQDMGIAMRLSDSTGFARMNTPLREAVHKRRFIIENEEEMRILYVAMTRARERLYIVGSTNKEREEMLDHIQKISEHSCPYTLKHCMTFLEWILLPFVDTPRVYDCATLEFYSPEEIAPKEEATKKSEMTADADAEVAKDEALFNTLCEKFDFSYDYSDLVKIPAKLSVSRLSPDILDLSDVSVDLIRSGRSAAVPDFFISDKPSVASAAERGTATHLFLQFCDFKRARAYGIEEEIARLVEKKFIPDNIADIIYVDELERFINGELANNICKSARVIREQRFNLLLPAKAFSKKEDFRKKLKDETLAVQGVIDLILIEEDGSIGLYDYKTDRLTDEELSSYDLAREKINKSHGLQLSYYAHAVSELFGRECSRICVYSTHASKLFDIDPIPLTLPEIE